MKAPNTDEARDTISVGITWIDLRCLFGPDNFMGKFWVGICHYTDKVYMWTPLDFIKPLMLTTVHVSPSEMYCNVSKECINFKCKFNRFNKQVFLNKFEGLGKDTLELPQKFGEEDLWFNDTNTEWHTYWSKFLQLHNMKPSGGKIEFSVRKWENIH